MKSLSCCKFDQAILQTSTAAAPNVQENPEELKHDIPLPIHRSRDDNVGDGYVAHFNPTKLKEDTMKPS